MPSSIIQRSFAGGEIAPALYGRADQVKYQTGLRRCRGFIVMRHGGVTLRTGTQFIKESKTSSKRSYFIKFVFNDDQTYVIETGDRYFRFYRQRARIAVSGVAAYSGATAYVQGDLVLHGGVHYYCVANTTGNAPPNATFWYPLTGDIYEIPTPYLEADLSALKFHQSGDVVTITHPGYAIRELRRTGHTAWTLTVSTFTPGIAAPGSLTNSGTAGSGGGDYVATAVAEETYEESLPSAASTTMDTASTSAPITLTIGSVTGAQEYNIYKKLNGVYGFIGIAGDTTFVDNGIEPDTSITPPIARDPFDGAGKFPSVGTYYQQRAMFANTNNEPEKAWTSRTGRFKNFTISSPLQDDDAVTFTLAGRKVNQIRHLVELDKLIILTAGANWIVKGDAEGVLRATQPVNAVSQEESGAAEVTPAIVGSSIVYVQARGTVVNDLRYQLQDDGYKGRDLTVYAPHLFEGRTIERMDYAQIPHSVVWAVRSDGVLLGLTYLKDHEIWGWHWHDTDGVIEDVCVVPEGDEDAVYVLVRRTIAGGDKRYIECFSPRFIEQVDDIVTDARYLDCHASYDGTNAGAITMALSTLTGWDSGDELTITASASFFVPGDDGNAIVLRNNGHEVTVTINGYVSDTQVVGVANRSVPASLRNITLTTWSKAVAELGGLGHLEGKVVSVFADGNVVASPNNDSYVPVTVTDGTITLDRPYSIVHVGLPYIGEIETLDIDINGEQVRDLMKNITSVSLLVESSRGIFVGSDEDHLYEVKPQEINYRGPQPLKTGLVEIGLDSTWEQSGRFLVRQVDPIPLTILAAIPNGHVGG